MDDSSETGQLIKFAPRDDAKPLVRKKPRDYQGCRHKYYEVDTELRTVTCDDCHEYLDPVQVLIWLCETYQERDYKYQKIMEFEETERKRAERRREREAAKRR